MRAPVSCFADGCRIMRLISLNEGCPTETWEEVLKEACRQTIRLRHVVNGALTGLQNSILCFAWLPIRSG